MGSSCCGGSPTACDSSSGENDESSTEEFTGTDEQPVLLTPAAVAAVKKAIEAEGQEGDGLRVSVIGGGCSGLRYNLDFEKDARPDDLTLTFDGVRLFVDPMSAGHLKGTTIDYVSGLQGTGFKFENPNAQRHCGCGESFA